MLLIFILGFSPPYYYNKDIHNMGNIGVKGNIHAVLAPLFTKIIDYKAYGGVNVREEIYNNLDGNVLDLCCGTGYSTKPGSVGIDTSLEMIRFAKYYNPQSTYLFGNAENYGEDKTFDIVTCMFAFHEMPNYAHKNIIKNAIRISKKKVIIVDISTNYTPSKLMLSGEPYLLNYLKTMDSVLCYFDKETIVENHVDKWTLDL